MIRDGVKAQLNSAKRWYWWLWLSPIVTVPFFIYLWEAEPLNPLLCNFVSCRSFYGQPNPSVTISTLAALLISALLHLILLVPALDKRDFVHWHGWQMLVLVAIRTFIVWFLVINEYLILLLPLIGVWLFGTSLGQYQASKGRCTLRALFGSKADWLSEQPPLIETAVDNVEQLVKLVRFGGNAQERQEAIRELQQLRLVETF